MPVAFVEESKCPRIPRAFAYAPECDTISQCTMPEPSFPSLLGMASQLVRWRCRLPHVHAYILPDKGFFVSQPRLLCPDVVPSAIM